MGIINMRFIALIAAAAALTLRDAGVTISNPDEEDKTTELPPTLNGKPFCNMCRNIGNTCTKMYTSATTVGVTVSGEEPEYIRDCHGAGAFTEKACLDKTAAKCT